MVLQKEKPVWWLCHKGTTVIASPDMTHIFRVIGRIMKRRMVEITLKQAVDAGFEIRRA